MGHHTNSKLTTHATRDIDSDSHLLHIKRLNNMNTIRVISDRNKKLQCEYFPLLEIAKREHKPGEFVALHSASEPLGIVRIVSNRLLRFSDLNEYVTLLSEGLSIQEYRRYLLRLHPRIELGTQTIQMLLVQKVKSRS